MSGVTWAYLLGYGGQITESKNQWIDTASGVYYDRTWTAVATISAVPEPTGGLLLLVGVALLALKRKAARDD